MKPRQLTSLNIALVAILVSQITHAASLTWDANGTGAGQTNGGGSWLGANQWWNGSANGNWVDGSDAVFGGPSTAGGDVTLGTAISAGSITFNTFTGTYKLGTPGMTLTVNGGINKTATAAAVSLTASPIALGAAQTWTNNSSSAFTITVPTNNNGQLLTIDGSGTTNFGTATTSVISGSGGITYNGTGRLFLGAGQVPAHTYTGTTTLNGGVTMVSNNNLGTGDLVLNGGVIESYWTTNFTRPLGNDLANTTPEVRIIGGASGFGNNNGGNNVILNNSASYEAVWGEANEAGNAAATGFFNPSTFVLNTQYTQNTGINFQNKIDLNGSTRTIQAGAGTSGGATATMSGVIRNTRGTTAGLVKTGPGLLILTAANTYDGGTTINQGNLRFGSLTAMPSSGNVTVNTGATLTIEAGAADDWTSGTSGVGTLGGLFSGLGSAGTSTVGFAGDATLGLEMTGNLTYAGDVPNLGDNLGITKSGGSILTLAGNNGYTGRTRVNAGKLSFNSISNVGGGGSALGAPATVANGTINIGNIGTAATITYTGSGHSTDRVINLSGSTGGATIDASGSGPLTLTSAITAAAGAKTLTLTGTNTAANTLGATAIPGLAEVLTITKSGAGTWWVNGFSSPKNAWSVTAGTLVAAGAITTGDQNVTVSGGTLAGVGPITLQSAKTLTVQAAGSLAPGNLAVGTLAVTGKLDISGMANGTGKLVYEMSAPAASDRIVVTGTFTIGTGLLGLNDFTFTDLGGMTSSTYVLISTTGGITGSLDPANVSGNIGSINGILQINGNNLEFTTDQDGDGLPDAYELANTDPSSATGLDPNADLENGGAGDGLTNLQEYLIGTNPNNPDTDADGLLDGVETNTGTWVSASNTGTNPLVPDTDGDTIRDGYETNTNLWVSSANTGTSPLNPDSDADALRDNVETNTGTNASSTNTGTNPNNPDTDNDGAGDWYEVTASFTSPFLAAEKPNVPYPLPDPDGSTGATNKPVKVYIMSGQSNMVGAGTVSGTGDGTLETMTLRQNKFPNLVTQSGAWTAREDVYYRGVISATADKKLGPGCGSGSGQIGPELGFGHVMGWFHDEGVLLLKSSIGNRALGWDILPAGSARYEFGGFTYCGSGDAAEKWEVGSPAPTWTTGGWYAGYEWDRFFRDESEWIHPHDAAVNIVDILDNWNTQYYGAAGKHFAGRDFQIAGFVWWQGERDAGDAGHSSRYEQNLVHLINSLRSYYSNRYPGKIVPNAPFVMATLGETSDTAGASNSKTVFDAMMAVGSGNHPQVSRVKTVYSYPLSEGGSGNSHYNNRAGTYMLVGDAMGRAMVELNSSASGNTFASWMASYPSVPPGLAGFDQDADGDGIDNGAENFYGTNPGVGNAGLISGAARGNTFTFTHPQNATPADGVTAAYRWSKDLTTFHTHGQTDGGNTTVSFNAVTNAGITTVTATVTGTAASRLFVDVKVTQN
jgi:autotransporter-associated beta strand protein